MDYFCSKFRIGLLASHSGKGGDTKPIILIVLRSTHTGPSTQDGDSDEEWPALGAAGEDDMAGGGVVEVDPEDEKAIQMFMNKNPPVRLANKLISLLHALR